LSVAELAGADKERTLSRLRVPALKRQITALARMARETMAAME
jgi:hypothetical protein